MQLAASGKQVDPSLSDYEPTNGVSGKISSVGSDSMANLVTLWSEKFKRLYPGINIQIQAAGSSTAAPALVQGTANFAPMSREMRDTEIQAFERRHGYPPTRLTVAIDTLAVYVHKDNPIGGMTIAEVDGVFSSTLRCGGSDVAKWGDFGLEGSWQQRDIQLYGRNSVSGTYGYFKLMAMCKGDFKNTVNEQPGSASVVQAVATSVNGVGYSGIGYDTSSVRAVSLSKKVGQPYIRATPENAFNGAYPLARPLFVYINKEPGKDLPPLEREFLRMILSKQGQEIVLKDGYIPLPAASIERTLSELDL